MHIWRWRKELVTTVVQHTSCISHIAQASAAALGKIGYNTERRSGLVWGGLHPAALCHSLDGNARHPVVLLYNRILSLILDAYKGGLSSVKY